MIVSKKTVLKVNINCYKCKTDVLKAVTKLTGVDEVAVDGERGKLTVIGDVDPVLIVHQIKKTGKVVEIISVGPAKLQRDAAADHHHPYDHKLKPIPVCCRECQVVGVLSFAPNYDGIAAAAFCSIL